MRDSENKSKKIFSILIYIIGLTIPLIITLGRILIPDTAYDTINYHTFIGERSWNWFYFSKIEFYPAGYHSFFPFLDMINSIGRHLLGYRLGTLTETIFFYLSVIIIFKIIRLLDLSTGYRILDTLLKINIFISFEALFQLASYLNDIISTFFVLIFLYIFILYLISNNNLYLLLSTSIMSFCVLFKYTNYIYFISYFLLLIFVIYDKYRDSNINYILSVTKDILIHISIFIVINGPWFLWNYYNTKNPLFPYFNNLFNSDYFGNTPTTFGIAGRNLWEKIIYPIYLFFDNSFIGRYQSLLPEYKISFYIIILFLSFPIFKKYYKNKKEIWFLYIYFVLTYLIWVFIFGYSRYAIAFEFIAGILLMALFVKMSNLIHSSRFKIVSIIILIPFLWQDFDYIKNNLNYDISWRPTLWNNKTEYLSNFNNISNNYYYIDNLDNIDIYLSCGSPNLGYIVPSNAINLPVLTLPDRNSESLEQSKYRIKAISNIPNILDNDHIDFITIIKSSGMDPNAEKCNAILDSYNAKIISREKMSFLGDKRTQIELVKGQIKINLLTK